jgi:PKD repeat protein
MKSKNVSISVSVMFAVLTISLGAGPSVWGESFVNTHNYTWGVDSDDLAIPDGSIITGAVLKIHDVTRTGNGQNGLLPIHLLGNVPLDFVANDNQTETNIFQDQGTLLTPVHRGSLNVTEDLIYDLGTINDLSSSVWDTFGYPFVFPLVDSTVDYSSTILSLIDYAGSGTSFGFGFDPNGMDDYTFDGISLEVTIEAFEGTANKSTLTFEYGITNDPPLMDPISDQSVAENSQLSFTVTASDPDGDTVTYSAQSLPTGAVFTGQDFTWTPDYDQAGTYQVTFIASDGTLQDSLTANITVTDTNRAPVLTSITNKSVPEDSLLTFTVNAADPDEDTVTYTAQGLPIGAAFTGQTFTWTPDYDQAGTYQVTFIASDAALQDSLTVDITVTETNRAPVLTPIANILRPEDSLLTFNVDATDPDEDTVTYTAQGLPTGAQFTGQTFTWTPDHTQAGTYQVTFIASDGMDQDSQTISVIITNTNRAPVLAPIANKFVAEASTLTFTVNATDPDGDTVTYSAQNLPGGAQFTGKTFTWTPNYTQAGTYQVTLVASDAADQDSQTISIVVINTNRAPVMAPIANKSVPEGSLLTFNVNATDPDGDTVTYTAQNLPFGAQFTGQTFTWTPNLDQAGTHQVTFIASDGMDQNSRTANITVTGTNQAPVLATVGNKSVPEDSLLTFIVYAADPDGDTITYSAQNLPEGAQFTGQTFTWTPTHDQAGTYQVTFVASDGSDQDSQTITITVTNSNAAPVLEAIGDKTLDERKTLTFTVSATDPDDDAITYSAQDLPAGATFDGETFSWRPWYGTNGTHVVTFIASDGQLEDSQTVTITVNPVKIASWYERWLKHVRVL